jgi:streptogramin lyase
MQRTVTPRVGPGPRAGLISAAAAVAVLASGCGGARAGAGSPAGGASPSFGPIPTTSAPSQQPVTRRLPKGVLASIPVDSAAGVGIGFGSVWVGSHRANLLTRIDPATGKVVAAIDTGMVSSCGTVSIGLGRVWVNGCDDDAEVVVIDPATNQVVGRFPHRGLSVGFGAGSAWIGGPAPAWTYRINPHTLHIEARFKVSGSCVVFARGSAWVADETTGTVAKINPSTNKVTAVIPAGLPSADGASAEFAAGYLWIYPGFESPADVTQAGNRVWRINPNSDTVKEGSLAALRNLPSTFTTGQFAAGMGSLWVRGYGTHVYRYDARTLRLLGVYPADSSAIGMMATGFGSLWVTNMDTSTLWRDRLTG